MIIGVPTELKVGEKRVGLTPAGVRTLVGNRHRVLLQSGAGLGSGFPDEMYARAGAVIRSEADNVWSEADMIVKVKEPIGPEFEMMHEDQVIFTYLHLAADKSLTEKLLRRHIIGIAYECTSSDPLGQVLHFVNRHSP